MSEQHRLVAAFAITFAILFGFNMFFDNPVQTTNTQQEAATFTLEAPEKVETKIIKNREEALSASKRVTISGERLSGSINLKGGRLDDITLIKYKEGVDEDSAPVKLLSPADTPNGYYVDFGWQGIDKKDLPNKDTLWQVKTDPVF